MEEGDDVILTCTADANPSPNGYISWEKLGSSGGTLPAFYSGVTYLALYDVKRSEAGQYRCVGNNRVPPLAYSRPITVTVHCESSIPIPIHTSCLPSLLMSNFSHTTREYPFAFEQMEQILQTRGPVKRSLASGEKVWA